ncbi:uncharacterized protein LOC119996050 [Tripterygium wilfordii]|uniref:uncharacterized protein LOC119996050 n=1 Tax=Tripterygium wilfordii TaxID=458696 RepID=UPI0018F84913|nr:uncharacterized protein LOC119996050 [Tripterygium wilfordii]
MINYNKTSLYFSRFTPTPLRTKLSSVIGAEEAQQYDRYLGLPAMVGRSKRNAFSYLVEKVRKRITSWSHRHLSQAGKEILVKAVLQAIPTYAMQLFKLPQSLRNELDQLLRQIWRGSNSNQKVHCWLAWTKLCSPKSVGGMGFHNFEAFNEALLNKDGGFLQIQIPCPVRFCKPNIFAAQIFEVSRNDNWLSMPLIYGDIARHLGFQRSSCVSSLIDWEVGWWNISLIEQVFHSEEGQMILKQSLGSRFIYDSVCWSGTTNGQYSVKSGYHRAMKIRGRSLATSSNSNNNGQSHLWQSIWSLCVLCNSGRNLREIVLRRTRMQH